MNNEHKQQDAREVAEALVAQRGLDWIGYDGENLVCYAVCEVNQQGQTSVTQ